MPDPRSLPDHSDAPVCVDCGDGADMFTASEWICDECSDARMGEWGDYGVRNPGWTSPASDEDTR